MSQNTGMALLGLVSSCALSVVAGQAVGQCTSSTASSCEQKTGWAASEYEGARTIAVMSSDHHRRPATVVDAAVEDGRFTILAKALGAAGLVDALKGEGPFTVFAPTDDAFRALERSKPGTLEMLLKPENKGLLTQILTFHVVPANVLAEQVVTLRNAGTLNGQRVDIKTTERGVTVDGANVIVTDVRAGNGTVHVIDQVLMPSTKTIVEIAQADSRFTTLVQAVSAAGLVETLSGKGPFTVFAPTNEAFAAVPGLSELLKPANRGTLQDILKFHVVPGRVYARDAVTAGRATTVEGSPVMIDITDGRLTVDGAQVVITDIEGTNGVIHVIDAVILPPSAR